MKKLTFIFAAAILAAGASSCSKSAQTDNAANTDEQTEQTAEQTVIPAAVTPTGTVTVLEDDALLRPGQPIGSYAVLDFNAVWCGPCKRLNAPMEAAAEAYKDDVAFYAVDFEKLPETAAAFEVTNVPVVVILTPDGQVQRYDNLSPFISEEDLKNLSKEEVAGIISESLCRYIEAVKQQ